MAGWLRAAGVYNVCMSRPLRRVNLMLDEPLIRKLKDEARSEETSMSALVRRILARELMVEESPKQVAERIRKRRLAMKRYPDSTSIVRESRDRGW